MGIEKEKETEKGRKGGWRGVVRAVAFGAALLLLSGCGAAATVASTPLPTSTVGVEPMAGYAPARLTVSCNGEAHLRLLDYWTGEEVHHGICRPRHKAVWSDLGRPAYILEARCPELGVETRREVAIYGAAEEVALVFPGMMVIKPVPADAEVEVDKVIYHGPLSLTYAAEDCPYTATVYVRAPGYQEDGRLLRAEAGRKHVYVMALVPLPTPQPTAPPARPTRPPATPRPTAPTFTVEERVALVRQKLYESVNCMRSENGQAPLPYIGEWQALADDYARAWRDHFIAHGVEGFDPTPWRQQFQAAGGDALRGSAGLPLYAPDYYVYLGPESRWEMFDMCDPSCPMYGILATWEPEVVRASGVVIGLSPWWDGDILNGAMVIGFKW